MATRKPARKGQEGIIDVFGGGRSATTKKPVKKAPPVKSKAEEEGKALKAALAHIEAMAKERVAKARDPVKMGLKLSADIRQIAERIENEVLAESLSVTEASEGAVGMGIGVL